MGDTKVSVAWCWVNSGHVSYSVVMTKTQTELITRLEAAELAGVSPRTIKRWAVAGRIETVRDTLSGRVRYRRKEVLEASGKAT